jgi:hypothetical protein
VAVRSGRSSSTPPPRYVDHAKLTFARELDTRGEPSTIRGRNSALNSRRGVRSSSIVVDPVALDLHGPPGMRVMIVVVLIAGLAGCTKRGMLAGGAITAGTGVVSLAMTSSQCGSEDIGCAGTTTIGQTIGPPLLIGGLIMLIAGAAMKERPPQWPAIPPLVVAPAQRPMQPAPPPPPIVAVPAVALQHQLAIQISEAARVGDCRRAIAIGRQLFQLDPDLHRTLAAIDAPYADCIANVAR